jgi:diazepam-binding inhibitor (GABA receptor modulator, acyl-CoA-binding protein)
LEFVKMNRFERYVEHVDNFKKSDSPPVISDAMKLKLYGLYKQSTIGDINVPQPGIFNMTDRAKWNAWHEFSGLTRSSAQKMYINTVKEIKLQN